MTSTGIPERLWLVRHGESEGNLADEAAQRAGHGVIDLAHRDMDVPLSERGRRQATALGRWWADQPPDERPEVVLTSPYARAAGTARLMVDAAGWQTPLRRDERLRERELGLLDGLTAAGIRERFPEEVERRRHVGKFYYRPPGGESWCDVALRVRAVLDTVARDHAGQRVLLVTHQAVVMVFRYVLEDLDEKQLLSIDAEHRIANCARTGYAGDGDGRLRLEIFNDAEPVADEGAPVTEEPPASEGGEPVAR